MPLEARSPFELRVDLGAETCPSRTSGRRSPPATWASCIRSPPARRWTVPAFASSPGRAGCMWRCHYCHNPDTWTMTNGIPVTLDRATEELRKYRHGLEVDGRRLHAERRRAADAGPLRRQALRRGARRWASTRRSRPTATTATGSPTPSSRRSTWCMLDIKAWDPARHRQLTGMDNAPTLEFARRLGALQRPIWVRYVLVPGLTDDPRRRREDRRVRRRARQRRTRRRAAVPPDGPLQVAAARPRLHPRPDQAACSGKRRTHLRDLPEGGPDRPLTLRSHMVQLPALALA